jgi:hypothetical protein
MTFEQRLKAVAWTEIEVGSVVLGAIASQQFFSDEKIFKKDFDEHPEWFMDGREGSPFLIKWAGGLKAGAALLTMTYVTNPWLRLVLMGVAFQGSLQQARVLTWNYNAEKEGKNPDRIKKIGDAASDLDAKLKAAADKYRTMGTEYLNGPEYLSGSPDDPLATRYESSVSGSPDDPLATRYESSVSGGMTKREEELFNLDVDDGTGAFLLKLNLYIYLKK